jgi:glycosyltransferase involved in cell wall biosynthesis
MTTRQPLVSIGMSVRNNEKTLASSLRSILRQTYANWELILIDDGSSDQTVPLARRIAETDERIRLQVDGARKGLPARLNETIDASRGDYYARMDGDDVAYPERLERQVEYLEGHPSVDLVGAWAIVFGAGGRAFGKRTGAEHHEEICARPHAGFPLIHPTYMGRIDYFRRNGYRAQAIRCEDQDMLLRSFDDHPAPLKGALAKSQDQDLLIRSYHTARFANVPEILLGYREEKIDLKKTLTSRYYLIKSLWHELRCQGRPVLAFRAVVEQVLKGALDVVAVETGLNYRLMRHRARPTTAAEVKTWERVWSALQSA